MSHFNNKNNQIDQYSNEFHKLYEMDEAYNPNYSAELIFNRRELELLKNQLIEKDMIINNLNYQFLKHKEDHNKILNERYSQNYEIKDIQENYEKILNENIEKTQKLNELREKNFLIENENYVI